MVSLKFRIVTKSTTVETKEYGCYSCSALFKFEDSAKRHVATEHSFKKQVITDFGALYFFEKEEDIDLFCEFSWANKTNDNFVAGWYIAEDGTSDLLPVAVYKEKLANRYKSVVEAIDYIIREN